MDSFVIFCAVAASWASQHQQFQVKDAASQPMAVFETVSYQMTASATDDWLAAQLLKPQRAFSVVSLAEFKEADTNPPAKTFVAGIDERGKLTIGSKYNAESALAYVLRLWALMTDMQREQFLQYVDRDVKARGGILK